MQYTTPPMASTTSTQVRAVEQSPSELSQDAANQSVKNAVLSTYLEKQIAKNESYKVITDVSVVDLQTNRALESHNLDTEQFAASVNKLPIAQLVVNDLRSGKLKPNQVLKWTSSDVRAGAGVYDQAGAPMQATVNDLLFDMLNPSGNTAVRVFVNQAFGGAKVVNQRFTQELGLTHTYLQVLDGTSFYVGNSTARESLLSLQRLLDGSDSYQKFVKNALATNIYSDYGVRSQLAGNDYIVLANKVGILDDPEGNNRHDVGIVYNTKTGKSYGYAFMTTAPGQSYNTPTAQAGISLANMGRATLRFAGDKATQNSGQSLLKDRTPESRLRY